MNEGGGSFQIKISHHFNVRGPKMKMNLLWPLWSLSGHVILHLVLRIPIYFQLRECGGGKSHSKDKYSHSTQLLSLESNCRENLKGQAASICSPVSPIIIQSLTPSAASFMANWHWGLHSSFALKHLVIFSGKSVSILREQEQSWQKNGYKRNHCEYIFCMTCLTVYYYYYSNAMKSNSII